MLLRRRVIRYLGRRRHEPVSLAGRCILPTRLPGRRRPISQQADPPGGAVRRRGSGGDRLPRARPGALPVARPADRGGNQARGRWPARRRGNHAGIARRLYALQRHGERPVLRAGDAQDALRPSHGFHADLDLLCRLVLPVRASQPAGEIHGRVGGVPAGKSRQGRLRHGGFDRHDGEHRADGEHPDADDPRVLQRRSAGSARPSHRTRAADVRLALSRPAAYEGWQAAGVGDDGSAAQPAFSRRADVERSRASGTLGHLLGRDLRASPRAEGDRRAPVA